MILKIRVIPKSSKNEITEISTNELKVKITKVPEKGKVNEQLIKMLSKKYKVTQDKIKIIKGKTIKNKIIEIE